jgi:hypothetical protein
LFYDFFFVDFFSSISVATVNGFSPGELATLDVFRVLVTKISLFLTATLLYFFKCPPDIETDSLVV